MHFTKWTERLALFAATVGGALVTLAETGVVHVLPESWRGIVLAGAAVAGAFGLGAKVERKGKQVQQARGLLSANKGRK